MNKQDENEANNLKTVEDRCMLEGAIGYIVYLIEEIEDGKFKTVEDLSKKLSEDGARASGALSHHFKDKLKIVGLSSGFPEGLS